EHKKDSLSKMGDSMRDMYYAIRTVVEIKNMSKQFQSSYSPPPDPLTHMASILIMQPLKGINRTPKLAKDYAALLILDSIIRNNKNIGFRGRTCNNCCACWVDPIYSNSEDMKSLIKSTKPSPHICDPKKVADAQINVQDIQNASKKALINLLVQLIIIYWCYFPQNKICLRTEEFTSSASCGG
ncbi:MAG: hypothetical protein ACJ72C_10680, partial [Nitrososphaeraceae archaeon]